MGIAAVRALAAPDAAVAAPHLEAATPAHHPALAVAQTPALLQILAARPFPDAAPALPVHLALTAWDASDAVRPALQDLPALRPFLAADLPALRTDAGRRLVCLSEFPGLHSAQRVPAASEAVRCTPAAVPFAA